jgi:Mg/Co/Ni transporter MgtE
MKHNLVLAKDLIGVGGLPKTIQGIHKKAKNEGWTKEAVALPGVRGRSFAYALEDLPSHVQQILSLMKMNNGGGLAEKSAEAEPQAYSVSARLMMLLNELSTDEMAGLVNLLSRKGVETALALLNEKNLQLLQLSEEEKERLLALHEAKKGASISSEEDDLNHPTHKRVSRA